MDDGTARSLSGTASYQSGNFSLQGSQTVWLDRQNDIYTAYHLKVLLDHVNGPGTYVCENTAASQIMYSAGAGPGTGLWNSSNAGSSASVTITNIDPVTGTISGTFTATLQPLSMFLKPKVISNGAFTATYC